MSFKSIVKVMKEGISNLYRIVVPCSSPSPSASAPPRTESSSQGQWANLPSELLLDVIQRIDASETTWPSRRALVACASVCKAWRAITKSFVSTLEQCGIITFPISLKQPAPRDNPIHCYIRRERYSSTFSLYLGLSPPTNFDRSKLLFHAKKVRRATGGTEFIISLVAKKFSKTKNTYIGKIRTNFIGTKSKIYERHPPLPLSRKIATISYRFFVLHSPSPRHIECTMHLIPTSSIQEGGTAPTPLEFASYHIQHESSKGKKPKVVEFDSTCTDFEREPLILKNKALTWSEQLQYWHLDFSGRVTVDSVKNFQLVAAEDPWEKKVILQFGKIGDDTFMMDYWYPLSAFQAFAICLSSFGKKPDFI
ncbi:tubby-like F-box protein 5 [Trifolium pratense]|nr:tubby-like F-box protein 5 [Trifolium pratense]